MDVISRRQIGTSPGHQFATSPGWSNRIFRGRPGDVGRGRSQDVLGNNICRLENSYPILMFPLPAWITPSVGAVTPSPASRFPLKYI